MSDVTPKAALVASADAWSEIGRAAAEKAQKATDQAHFGTAETHRKNAAQAFEFECKLRALLAEKH